MNINARAIPLVLAAFCTLSSCEEGEDGLDGLDAYAILFDTRPEPEGGNCENGGVMIEIGYDKNANNVLDAEEIRESTFVCNGTDGNDGKELIIEKMDEPSGENCTAGGIRLLIGHDINKNGSLETEEVEDTSYICNGEDTIYEGKTYLILAGDISNEEAQAKINRDVGVNTQFVRITGTTRLTRVDLSQIVELAELQIEDNEALESVNLSNLQHIFGNVEVNRNPIRSLEIASMERVSGYIQITGNDFLNVLNLSGLRKADYVSLERNASLHSLVLGHLESCDMVVSLNSLETLDLSALSDARDVNLLINEPELVSLDLANLTTIRGLSVISGLLKTLDVNALVSSSYLMFRGNFESISIPNLESLTGDLDIQSCERLVGVSLNRLVTAGRVSIQSCPVLEEISMVNLTSINELTVVGLPALVSLSAAGLRSISEGINVSFTNLSELELSLLESTGMIQVSNNPQLTAVDVDNLVESGNIHMLDNPLLASISLSSLSSINLSSTDKKIVFQSNAFSSVTVNYLLSILVNLDPVLTGGQVNLTQQPSASPTGDGLIDKVTLESNGNSVVTD